MTYAHIIDVPVPIEGYDAVHRAMIDRMNGGSAGSRTAGPHRPRFRVRIPGHRGLGVQGGSRSAFQELVIPVIDSVNPSASAGLTQRVTEFEVRGMVLAGRQIVT